MEPGPLLGDESHHHRVGGERERGAPELIELYRALGARWLRDTHYVSLACTLLDYM